MTSENRVRITRPDATEVGVRAERPAEMAQRRGIPTPRRSQATWPGTSNQDVKQSQFAGAPLDDKHCSKKKLRGFKQTAPAAKTKPISRVCSPEAEGSTRQSKPGSSSTGRAKQSQFAVRSSLARTAVSSLPETLGGSEQWGPVLKQAAANVTFCLA